MTNASPLPRFGPVGDHPHPKGQVAEGLQAGSFGSSNDAEPGSFTTCQRRTDPENARSHRQ
ncbi:hypothetical protein [Actinoplanes derwentensis]|uniref:hypothetical protein n=1 Tax=Actinoplanes derwentensis TaxID=113562 RepID=UPI0012FE17F9|nr:hypothetical protein [Actinoplanes derwentensis]GID81515.1 hypothetical protein Ade03nite_04390 [Actinoplanes derwentensis]